MMNTLKLTTLGIVLFFSSYAKAQVSLNVNIGQPPLWGPTGYNEVQYYYLPDVESYYDVNTAMFIYFEEGVWIHRSYLAKRYRNYNLYNGYKVVLTDYQGHSPYDNHNMYKNKYKKGYKNEGQKTNGPHPVKGNSNTHHPQKKSDTKQNGGLYNKENNSQHSKPNKKGNGGGKKNK